MFEHLNVKTRRLVGQLCDGKSIVLGGVAVAALDTGARGLLAVLGGHLADLEVSFGQDLVTKVHGLCSGFDFEAAMAELRGAGKDEGISRVKRFRLGTLRACSFRGLAPAGIVWEHDFEGKSHLLYGPNGCGKSSLLGAISWCLTGKIYRDDCEPCEPQKVKGYPVDGERCGRIERDDAYSLIDENGNS